MTKWIILLNILNIATVVLNVRSCIQLNQLEERADNIERFK